MSSNEKTAGVAPGGSKECSINIENDNPRRNENQEETCTEEPPIGDLVAFKDAKRWVAWAGEKPDKPGHPPKKVPYDPNSRDCARVNDPSTFGDLPKAHARSGKLLKPFGLGGIGIVLGVYEGTGLGGIDLDACRDEQTGQVSGWAQIIVNHFGSYTEVSPSRTGLKIFIRYDDKAEVPRSKTFKMAERDRTIIHGPQIEWYGKKRFFAVTGERYGNTPLRVVSVEDIMRLVNEFGPMFAGKTSNEVQVKSRNARRKTTTVNVRRLLQELPGALKPICADEHDQWVRVGLAIKNDLGEDGFGIWNEWSQSSSNYPGEPEAQKKWDQLTPNGELTCATIFYLSRNPDAAHAAGEDRLILKRQAPFDNARKFQEKHFVQHGVRTLHHQQDIFYSYQGSHYAEVVRGDLRKLAYEFLDGALHMMPNGQLISFHPTKALVDNFLDALKSVTSLSGSIKTPAWLHGISEHPAHEMISCTNGLVHLKTRNIIAHTPQYFGLTALGFDYDPNASSLLWDKFLSEVWPGDQEATDTLHEIIGYILTSDTSQQKAFMLVGPKRSGKGTIVRILQRLVGQRNYCAPTFHSLGTNFGMQPFIGKLLAVMSDARQSGRMDITAVAERILTVTGEDDVTIDRKHKEAWTGKLPTRILMSTNKLPSLTDASGAFDSRFIVLIMKESFYGKEDPGLTSKLIGELPGILNKGIAGWERLNARGHFVQPASSSDAVQDLAESSSPISAYIADRCKVEPNEEVPCQRLYLDYRDWCGSQGRDYPGTASSLGADLRAAVPSIKTSRPRGADGSRERIYKGIDLQADWRAANRELVSRLQSVLVTRPAFRSTHRSALGPLGAAPKK